jgi:CRP-like cAMP-binding protein
MFGLTTFFRSAPPGFTARAATPVLYLTMDRAAHEQLRRENPRTAEQLALAAVHVLADRIEILDRRISDDLAEHPEDHPKVTEWSSFRSRLFEASIL